MSTPTKLQGTLFLDVGTVATAPGFFSLLALVMRASGMEVMVVGRPPAEGSVGVDDVAARLGIGFNHCRAYPGTPQGPGYAGWKHHQAIECTKKGPVVWPDMDLNAAWKGPPVDNVPGLTILNWSAVIKGQGMADVAQPQSLAQG